MKRRQADRILDALTLRDTPGAICEYKPGRFIIKSMTRPNRTYGARATATEFYCACRDNEARNNICKHLLALYPAVAEAAYLFRCARDLEELEIALDHAAARLTGIPERVLAIARDEYDAMKQILCGEQRAA